MMKKTMAAIGTLVVLGFLATSAFGQDDRPREGKPGADRPSDRPQTDRPADRPRTDRPHDGKVDRDEDRKKPCGVTLRDILQRTKDSDRKITPPALKALRDHYKNHKDGRCHCRCDRKCKDRQAHEERARRERDGRTHDRDDVQRDGKLPGRHRDLPRLPRGGAPRR